MESVDPGNEGRGAGVLSARRLVVIGNMDGVHRGHQALLARAAREAGAAGLEPLLLTFSPHPLALLGGAVPPLLTRLPRRRELVERGFPPFRMHVARFDAAFAAQPAEVFARDVLAGELRASAVLVGENFRFGQGRKGNPDELVALGRRFGFEARVATLSGDGDGAFSSSRVRRAITAGRLDEAGAILGRPHMVSGRVVTGDRRGRTIGFPTANLGEIEELLPPPGVYAVAVDIEGEAQEAPSPPRPPASPLPSVRPLAKGVANLGLRPTFAGAEPELRLEAHLLDFEGDLYDRRLRLHLVGRLREERKFDGIAALRAQIERDAEAARAALAHLQPPDGRDGEASRGFF